MRLYALTWEAPDQTGVRFGCTEHVAVAPAEVLERFAELADIAAEEGTGDPLAGSRMRRFGHVIDLGVAERTPAGYPGIDLDAAP